MQGNEHDRGSLNDYIQALAAALELPDDGGAAAAAAAGAAPQRMSGTAAPSGSAPGAMQNFQGQHAQYNSPSPHPSPRARDPFSGTPGQAQAHSGAHSAGNSAAYSNHSGGAYNSGASGGQRSAVSYHGYDNPHAGGGGHYPAEVPAATGGLLRGPLDDVWPTSAPNTGPVSGPGSAQPQGPRPTSGDLTGSSMQSVFNMNGPFPPRPPTHSQLPAPAGGSDSGRRRQSLGAYGPFGLPSDNNRSASGYSGLSSGGDPTYPLSGPHSEGAHNNRPDAVQSIVSLNTLGLTQNTPASWDGISGHMPSLAAGDNNSGQGGYLTPRGLSVTRASSAPLTQPAPVDGSGGQVQQAPAARPKRRRRNEQQQVNNKLAQQRYREKQKQKTRELESQVEELTAQVKALETSSARSRELMQENETLRTQQQQLQAHVAKLQVHIKRIAKSEGMEADGTIATADELAAPESSPNSACVPKQEPRDSAAVAAALAAAQATGMTPPGSPLAGVDVDMEDRSAGGGTPAGDAASSGGQDAGAVVQRLTMLADHMRKLLSDQGLPRDSVLPEDMRYTDMTLRRELATVIQSNSSICSKLLLGKGSEASVIMQTDPAAARELWGRCLVGINLCEQQVTQILEARTKLLQRLQNLSEVRNHLALRAVGILLPSRQRPQTHQGHEARLHSLETNGAFEVLAKEHELQESLDEVTSNLLKGRAVVVEFSQYVTTKVLKVEQAAVLLLITHPYHPDCLALANLMAQTRRNVTSGTGPS